jgi:hypothetical protein
VSGGCFHSSATGLRRSLRTGFYALDAGRPFPPGKQTVTELKTQTFLCPWCRAAVSTTAMIQYYGPTVRFLCPWCRAGVSMLRIFTRSGLRKRSALRATRCRATCASSIWTCQDPKTQPDLRASNPRDSSHRLVARNHIMAERITSNHSQGRLRASDAFFADYELRSNVISVVPNLWMTCPHPAQLHEPGEHSPALPHLD